MKDDIVYVSDNMMIRNNTFTNCLFKSTTSFDAKNVKFVNCSVSYCIFKDVRPLFDNDCLIECNIYPYQYNEDSILKDVNVNDLPEGDIIGYKKVWSDRYTIDEYGDQIFIPLICKLLIPKTSKRVRGVSRKCRTNKALVLGLYTEKGRKSKITEATSDYDDEFKYTVGQFVTPRRPFSQNPLDVCSSGIHFFTRFKEAVDYL